MTWITTWTQTGTPHTLTSGHLEGKGGLRLTGLIIGITFIFNFFVVSSMLNYSPENAENLKIIFEKLKLSEALRPYKHLFIGDLKMANLLSGNYFLLVVIHEVILKTL